MAFRCKRWTLANILPLCFVVWIILSIWLIHGSLHLFHLLQIGVEKDLRDEARYARGLFQAVVSQLLTVLLGICFLRAVFTDPGSVPERPEWRKDERAKAAPPAKGGDEKEEQLVHHEVKQSGERRFCKWCDTYKPDRCHHCRVCRSCVLRMDHHCPWIANCVGFHNHKYFFLLVFYALVDVAFIIVTMSESVTRVITEEATSRERFFLIFGMTLSGIMGFLLQMFFTLHVWLMFKATTTIEFCEKRTKRAGTSSVSWAVSVWKSVQAVLGSNFFLMLLPCSPPDGEGIYFERAKDSEGVAESSQAGQETKTSLLKEESMKKEGSPKKVNFEGVAEENMSRPEVTTDRAAAA